MEAAALIVGIDGYANLPLLQGSTEDALDVANLLIDLGAPKDRIYLHVSPTPGQAVTLPAGLSMRSATRDEIWGSIIEIGKGEGKRLYVFLSGHGYYLAETGPIFLTQDWSQAFGKRNLDITAFTKYFRSLQFRDQLFVVDACQNYATDPIYRSPIPASGPDIANFTPNPSSGLVLCCAADQGQYAVVSEGRGLLTRNLLSGLKAALLGQLRLEVRDAIDYDWRTGSRRLNLKPLFDYYVRPAVAKAAVAEHANQTPTIQAHGRSTSETVWHVIDFQPPQTAQLNITAAPEEGLESLRIELRPPVRELNLSLPEDAQSFPFQGFAPRGSRLIATCTPKSSWVASPHSEDVIVPERELTVRFELSRPPKPPPELEEFNLKLVTRSGDDAFELSDGDYAAAGVNLAEASRAYEPGRTPAGTPSVILHENGPDIQLNGASLEDARRLAEQLRDSLNDKVRGRELEVFLSPPGKTIEQSRPNLRLSLPDGGAEALVGYLGPEPLIRLERIGGDRTKPTAILSADQVAKQSLLRVEPGAYRVCVDAPWGIGVTAVDVPEVGVATCVLPEVVGREPLRNVVIRNKITIDPSAELFELPPLPAPPVASKSAAKAGPGGIPRYPGVTVLFRREGDAIRAEPYSDIRWSEWDILIGAGRLEAVDLSKAAARLDSAGGAGNRGDLNVLLLALAYAARAQGRPERLESFLGGLSSAFARTSDAVLLQLALRNDKTYAKLDTPLFGWAAPLVTRHSPMTQLPALSAPRSTWFVPEFVAKTALSVEFGAADARERLLRGVDAETKVPATTETKLESAPPSMQMQMWRPFENLRRGVDRLFEDFYTSPFRPPFRRPAFDIEPFWAPESRVTVPAVDFVEHDDAFEMTADLPGLDEKNIELKVANGVLTVKGEKTEDKEEKKGDFHLRDRRFGSFERSFRIPETVDTDKIEASFKQGVLTVTLPKTAEAQKPVKTIAVKGE